MYQAHRSSLEVWVGEQDHLKEAGTFKRLVTDVARRVILPETVPVEAKGVASKVVAPGLTLGDLSSSSLPFRVEAGLHFNSREVVTPVARRVILHETVPIEAQGVVDSRVISNG